MNTPIVYVVQNPGSKNILPAEKHGKLRVILSGDETPKEATEKLFDNLKHILPHDYLVQIGSPLNIGIATHLAMCCNAGLLNILVWDQTNYTYIPVLIDTTAYANQS